MSVWGWVSVVFLLAVVALVVWALRAQKRMYPADRPHVREPEERGEIRWTGLSGGGGHG